jgi:hypothetical protein
MNERATGVALIALALIAGIAHNLISPLSRLDVISLVLAMAGIGYLIAADGDRFFKRRPGP